MMGATCPAHKYRLMKVRLLMRVWIITACIMALIITAASSLCARVDFLYLSIEREYNVSAVLT